MDTHSTAFLPVAAANCTRAVRQGNGNSRTCPRTHWPERFRKSTLHPRPSHHQNCHCWYMLSVLRPATPPSLSEALKTSPTERNVRGMAPNQAVEAAANRSA